MKSVRIDLNDGFYAFHSFSSEGSKFLIANAQHYIFKSLEQVSNLCLNIKESDDVPHISRVYKVPTSYPSFIFLECISISDRIKLILTL